MKIAILIAASALVATAASSQPVSQGGTKLSTTLTGAAEVPGPGDTDGSGSFSATVNPGQGRLCYQLSATGIDTPTAAHIHIGTRTLAGPIVVGLTTPTGSTTFTSSGCITSLSREVLNAIRKAPEVFYVNVHNAAFPGGAIRGQL